MKRGICCIAVVLVVLLAAPFMAAALEISATGNPSIALPGPLIGMQILFDQSDSKIVGYASQDFAEASDACDIYAADDFVVPAIWWIDAIHVIGVVPGGPALAAATSLSWAIYADNAGSPAGYPGSGAAPLWSISLPPSNPQVTLRDGNTDVSLVLNTPVSLAPGKYWLMFYVVADQQWFWANASSINGYISQLVNPGLCFGITGTWKKIMDAPLCSTWRDFAFRLDGRTSEPGPGPHPTQTTIPTLGQWGMIFFALLLAVASFVVVRRKVSERRR